MFARLILLLLRLARRIEAPEGWPDRWLARFAMACIDLYRAGPTRLTGRECLFQPSCSVRSRASLREFGWNAGVPEAVAQVERCHGDYAIEFRGEGLVLETRDGRVFPEQEIAAGIKARLVGRQHLSLQAEAGRSGQ